MFTEYKYSSLISMFLLVFNNFIRSYNKVYYFVFLYNDSAVVIISQYILDIIYVEF